MIFTICVSFRNNSQHMKKYLFIFSITAGIVACAPKITETIQENIPTTEIPPETSLSEDAIEGKQIYAKKCSSCHEMKVIDDYTKKQWEGILPDMSEKAKLNEIQTRQVASFVNWELIH